MREGGAKRPPRRALSFFAPGKQMRFARGTTPRQGDARRGGNAPNRSNNHHRSPEGLGGPVT